MGRLTDESTVSETVRLIQLDDQVAAELFHFSGSEVMHHSGAFAEVVDGYVFV